MAASDGRQGGLVLLVDDEEMIREIGSEILKKMGFRVVTAAGGRQALEYFADLSQEIEFVILDLAMPEMDGEETFDALWKIRPGIKVILSSGYGLDAKALRVMEKGCRAFLQKPFRVNALAATVKAVLENP